MNLPNHGVPSGGRPGAGAVRIAGTALVMVLLVLAALAIVGAPFVISMGLQERSSSHFDGEVKARRAAEAARNHAIALLEETVRAVEIEAEVEALGLLDPVASGRPAASPSARRQEPDRASSTRRRGTVIRRAFGQRPERREDRRFDPRGLRSGNVSALPGMLESEKGPSEKDYDTPDELEAPLPGEVEIPWQAARAASPADPAAAPSAPSAPSAPGARSSKTIVASAAEPIQVSFRDPAGITAAAEVQDEQGKVNINTAPPNLIAALFGAATLERPLGPRDTALALDDASPFRSDGDPRTLDGAVVVVHPSSGRVEAITYRGRRGNALENCFRGAFFSIPSSDSFPEGSPVYDLRGWKAGHHRLRASALGSFAPSELAEFSTVESIREISNWQVASLFLMRFREEGLTPEFLQRNGIRTRQLEELGLDPALFEGDDPAKDPALKALLEQSRKMLQRRRVPRSLIDELQKARGARAVAAFAARVAPLSAREAQQEAEKFLAALRKEKRRSPSFDPGYLEACLRDLGEAYRTPGIETILPAELEVLRPAITVSSQAPARWSEAQVSPDAIPGGDVSGESFRVARPGDHGGGALVRLRRRGDSSTVEYNQVVHRGRSVPENGFGLLLPVLYSYPAGEAMIDFLERHPVNVNSASERVLRAVFTGVSGHGVPSRARREKKDGGSDADMSTPGMVTPAEAAKLAAQVRARVPLQGTRDFWDLLVSAASAGAIDDADVSPLFVNSLQPNHHLLRVSTTGLCYASGDVYTIESRGILRNPAGGEVARSTLREIVEVSPPRPLAATLFTQADFTTELFLRDPYTPMAPEDHYRHAVTLPGMRGHLVRTTPVLQKVPINVNVHSGSASSQSMSFTRFPVPGGERGTLRLETAEARRGRYTFGEIFNFRETRDGLELTGGEPWMLDIALSGGAGGGPQVPNPAMGPAGGISAGAGLGGVLDLTNLPAAVEAWMRFLTFPQQTNQEGMLILMDAGAEEERNRISLLYDRRTSEWVARIYDSSLPDPSIPQGKQYFEVRAMRPLDLETWYHVRLAWDGAFAGGIQLFIDGLPVGRSNYATELAGNLSPQGGAGLPVRSLREFPRSGVLRIGQELVEYEGGSIRMQPPSAFRRWLDAQPIPQRGRQGPGGSGPLPVTQPGSAAQPAPATALPMRGPWNERASAPGNHAAGAPVSLHGYSLEIVRKYQYPAIHQAGSGELVWGRGGLALAEPLLPWIFPEEVEWLVNFNPQVQLPGVGPGGGPGGGRGGAEGGARGGAGGQAGGSGAQPGQAANPGDEFIAPVFEMEYDPARLSAFPNPAAIPTGLPPGTTVYSPAFQWGGQIYNAAEFFQSEGVLALQNGAVVRYRKAPLPAGHTATQPTRFNPDGTPTVPGRGEILLEAQTTGLQILGPYQVPGTPPVVWNPQAVRGTPGLRQLSVLAGGPATLSYPTAGILELRGAPPPWHQPQRPDLTGAPFFGPPDNHPDDLVEWLRYEWIDGRLFVGHTNYHSSNHRGYPETRDRVAMVNGVKRVKNQMWHRAGTPLRLVMELADGGAGHGDYVSIATSDPSVFEPRIRRVFRVSERNDGRFFISLVDVHPGSGQEMSNANVPYTHDYFKGMNPRLVKFPTGAPPLVGTGRLLFFGDAVRGGPPAGGALAPRDVEEEPTSGFILDEVRRFENPLARITLGLRVRHLLVPLENGRVGRQPIGSGEETLDGVIPANRSVSRQNPLEILVVSAGRDNRLFAEGIERGILRIGEELFHFENPLAQDAPAGAPAGAGSGAIGRARLQGIQGSTAGTPSSGGGAAGGQAPPAGLIAGPVAYGGERAFNARTEVVGSIQVSGMSGYFEREGFARIDDTSPDLRGFYEIFYYQGLGNGFSHCLRGQFQTPLATEHDGNRIQNVTVRLRLTGRGLLGTERRAHGLADPVSLVTSLDVAEIAGPLTDTGLPVIGLRDFPPLGYLLIDSTLPGQPFEMMAYQGIQGENLFLRPRDEDGRGILRGSFGTIPRPVGPGMFAYAIPFRHFDRYQAEAESESLAYFQKSFRVPGALWRRISWRERRPRVGPERLPDVVVAARFDGAPDWSAKPDSRKGGLFLLEAPEGSSARWEPSFDLGVAADQLELRVYFRYPSGSFMRVGPDAFRDDWKETPVLELLSIEYEKAGRILRHEETRF